MASTSLGNYGIRGTKGAEAEAAVVSAIYFVLALAAAVNFFTSRRGPYCVIVLFGLGAYSLNPCDKASILYDSYGTGLVLEVMVRPYAPLITMVW